MSLKTNLFVLLVLMLLLVSQAYSNRCRTKNQRNFYKHSSQEFFDRIGKENHIRFYFREEWISKYVVNQLLQTTADSGIECAL
jgi:hypothetical protein